MWQIGEVQLTSRLLIGTALYPSPEIMRDAVITSGTEIVTVSLKRQLPNVKTPNQFWQYIKDIKCHVLPNTAGCRNAKDAVTTAEMAREIFATNWIKLEVIGDEYNLQPDAVELLKATEILIAKGFEVLPYCTDDLVLCQRLVKLGCKVIMPWGAPIGSGKGLVNPYALSILRQRLPDVTLIVDAGIGLPSHAAKAMEMGYDAVLLNSAVALANDPVIMAGAFKHAVIAGREAYQAGAMPEREMAKPSTPLIDTPFWHEASIP